MNGIHDMAGMHGMGPVEYEKDEPVFHHDWERRVFALSSALGFGNKWNIDMGRFGLEQLPPATYLASSYYERWLLRLERLLVEKRVLTEDELASGRPNGGGPGDVRVLQPDQVESMLRIRHGARVEMDIPPKFKAGDKVVARKIQPLGHTRLPRYVRGRQGAIDRDHGVFIFPDTHAVNWDEKPQHLYSVRFAAQELWGSEVSALDAVYLDMWDDYLEPA